MLLRFRLTQHCPLPRSTAILPALRRRCFPRCPDRWRIARRDLDGLLQERPCCCFVVKRRLLEPSDAGERLGVVLHPIFRLVVDPVEQKPSAAGKHLVLLGGVDAGRRGGAQGDSAG